MTPTHAAHDTAPTHNTPRDDDPSAAPRPLAPLAPPEGDDPGAPRAFAWTWTVEDGPYAWVSPDGRDVFSSGAACVVARGAHPVPPEWRRYRCAFSVVTNTEEVTFGFAPRDAVHVLNARTPGAELEQRIASCPSLYTCRHSDDGVLEFGVDFARRLFFVSRGGACVDATPLEDAGGALAPVFLTRRAHGRGPVRVQVSARPAGDGVPDLAMAAQAACTAGYKRRTGLWTGARTQAPALSVLHVLQAQAVGAEHLAVEYDVCPAEGLVYFELEVDDGLAMLGCASGADCESYCMYFGTGNVYTSDTSGVRDRLGPRFAEGDVVGCGFDCVRRSLFYTLNGSFLGIFHDAPRLSDTARVQPVFGSTPGRRHSTNFGHKPFLYHPEHLQSSIRDHAQHPLWPEFIARVQFPPEIVSFVLSSLRRAEPDDAPDEQYVQAVAACRLTCRHWAQLLRPAFFEEIHLQSARQLAAFRRVLEDDGVRGLIRTVYITDEDPVAAISLSLPLGGETQPQTQPGPARRAKWSHQCLSCPPLDRVDVLYLDARYPHAQRPALPPSLSLHPFLPYAAFGGATRLVLVNYNFRAFRAFVRVAAAFRALRVLECTNVWWEAGAGAATARLRHVRAARLQEVRFAMVGLPSERHRMVQFPTRMLRWEAVHLLTTGADAGATRPDVDVEDNQFVHDFARIVDGWGHAVYHVARVEGGFGPLRDVGGGAPEWVVKYSDAAAGAREDVVRLSTSYEPDPSKARAPVNADPAAYRYALHFDLHLAPLRSRAHEGARFLAELVVDIAALGEYYAASPEFMDMWHSLDAAVASASVPMLQRVRFVDSNRLLEEHPDWVREMLERMPHCRNSGLLHFFKQSRELLVQPDENQIIDVGAGEHVGG